MSAPVPRDRASSERYILELLVDSVSDYAIFMLDPDGCVRTWNRGAERINGYTADEIHGRHFSLFYPAVDVRSGKPQYELAVAAEVGRFEDVGWRIRRDGSRFWANVIISAVRDHNEELVGFAKVTRDLTERKRAEDERAVLLEAERSARLEAERARERIEAMQAVTEAGLAHLELRQLLPAILETVRELLFADTAVVLAREGHELVPIASVGIAEDTDHVRVPIGAGFAGRVAATREPIVLEDIESDPPLRRVLRESGVRSLLGVPLLIGGVVRGVLHVGNFSYRRFLAEDISLLQQIGDRVALALDHARAIESERAARAETLATQQAMRLREEFVAVAAHELKTPATSLRLSLQLAERRLRAGSVEAAAELLAESIRQSERLDQLTVQLLDVSRIEDGRIAIKPEDTDVSAVVLDAARLVANLTGREILARDVPEAVRAEIDGLRFSQVVVNLLNNAVKYAPDDAPPTEVTLRTTGDAVQLYVRDHGRGIPEARRHRLFQRFSRLHEGDHASGLGLGLYLARSVVEAHGGHIWAEFPEDGGSLFAVELPLRHQPTTSTPGGA